MDRPGREGGTNDVFCCCTSLYFKPLRRPRGVGTGQERVSLPPLSPLPPPVTGDREVVGFESRGRREKACGPGSGETVAGEEVGEGLDLGPSDAGVEDQVLPCPVDEVYSVEPPPPVVVLERPVGLDLHFPLGPWAPALDPVIATAADVEIRRPPASSGAGPSRSLGPPYSPPPPVPPSGPWPADLGWALGRPPGAPWDPRSRRPRALVHHPLAPRLFSRPSASPGLLPPQDPSSLSVISPSLRALGPEGLLVFPLFITQPPGSLTLRFFGLSFRSSSPSVPSPLGR